MEVHNIEPVYDENSRVLILGSFPSVKSREQVFFYAHPQNRFWKVMGALCGENNLPEFDYDTKLKILLNDNIALWDTIKSCKRKGSLDSDIKNEQPNNIRKLLKNYPSIKIICLNGNKSYSAFEKYFPDLIEKYSTYKMPSTSPANAKYSLNKLIEEWSIILQVTKIE